MGTYTSGIYQEFRSKPIMVPIDYKSGGIVKVYGFLDATSGSVYFSEIGAVGTRIGENSQSLSWYGAGVTAQTISADQDVVVVVCEIDVGGTNFVNPPIKSGDIFVVRVQRRANDANDTASSGYFVILGFEFFYNTNIPKKTY